MSTIRQVGKYDDGTIIYRIEGGREVYEGSLVSLEWKGRAGCMPGAMHLPVTSWVPACPCCGGIHPVRGINEFVESALGHRPSCELKTLLESHK